MNEYHYESSVMGCDLAISIVAPHKHVADSAHDIMQEMVRAADARFSRFIPESELSQLNNAQRRAVSPEFMEVFLMAKRLYEETDKAFNPLVAISRFGYDADIAVVRGTNRDGQSDSHYDISLERIIVDGHTLTLAPGQCLDFGGLLKGHMAERMAHAVPGLAGVIVNLGGDLYTLGHDADGNPFEFHIEHPLDGHRSLSFSARDIAIATSGSYRRHWSYRGTPFHHILDRTGSKNPDTDILSVTVLAPSGADADAYATAALVLGSDKGAQLLQARGYDYCLITTDGTLLSTLGVRSELHAYA